MKYEVKDVVCDYGVFENDKLCLICNSRRNALQIVDIMRADTEHEILVLQPVVHGHWIKRRFRKEPIELNRHAEVVWINCIQCSHCGAEYAISGGYELYYKFCPNCAAKMDGESK